MIPVRLAFYALYVVLGALIVVRLAAGGLHWELATGIIFGLLLMALGVYRIFTFLKGRAPQP